MGTVIGIVVVIAALVVAWILVQRLLDRRALGKLDPSERERVERIWAQNDAILKAIKQQVDRVSQLEREYEKVSRGRKLASYSSDYVSTPSGLSGMVDAFKSELQGARRFVLYEDRIETPSGTHPLTPTVEAHVDSAGGIAGKSRSTLTRMGAGTLIAGPVGLLAGAAAQKGSVVDKRELYLLIAGDGWADSATCDPNHGAKVRDFAGKVNAAARVAGQGSEERARKAAAIAEQLREARDRRSILAMITERDRLGPDPTGRGKGELIVKLLEMNAEHTAERRAELGA